MTIRTPAVVLPEGVRQLLRQRIEANLELPIQSQTSALVLAECNNERCDAQRLSTIISLDQSLTGHVLGVANSATYAPKEPIVSLQQAISRLGISTICEIAVAVSLKGKVFDVPGFGTLVREMWMHSAATAVYSREVARLLRANVEGAFLSGLLHDVGRPIVLQNLVDVARTKTDKPVPAKILMAAMEEFHAAVGKRMVEHWDLPEWMGIVVEHHHDYKQAPERARETMIVHLGDQLAHWALDEGNEECDFDANIEVLDDLNVYSDDLAKLLALRGDVLDVTEAFL